MGVPLHGVSCEVVVYVPHAGGVTSAARGPPNRLSSISPSGSCGRSSNASAIWPGDRGRAWPCPPSLICTPPPSTTTYSPISDPSNASGCARYTAPFSGCSQQRREHFGCAELRRFRAQFAAGPSAARSRLRAVPVSGVFVHAPNPFAADSEIAIPGGSVTVSRSRVRLGEPFDAFFVRQLQVDVQPGRRFRRRGFGRRLHGRATG